MEFRIIRFFNLILFLVAFMLLASPELAQERERVMGPLETHPETGGRGNPVAYAP